MVYFKVAVLVLSAMAALASCDVEATGMLMFV